MKQVGLEKLVGNKTKKSKAKPKSKSVFNTPVGNRDLDEKQGLKALDISSPWVNKNVDQGHGKCGKCNQSCNSH